MPTPRSARFALVLPLLLLLAACGGGSSPAPVAPPPPAVTDFTPASPRLDKQALLDDFKALCDPALGGRRMGSSGNETARAMIEQRFTALGLKQFGTSYRQPFSSRSGTGINVIGYLEGTQLPNEFVLFSAHFDHIGTKNGQVVAGADDNASGTAAVLRLADYLKKHPPARSVAFCLFDGEELGLYGSEAFAAAPPAPITLSKIKVVINLDMIAQGTQGRIFVGGTTATASLKPTLLEGFATSKVKVVPDFEKYNAYSDQSPFLDRGVAFLFFCVGDDDPYYHTVYDTYDRIPHVFYWATVEAVLDTFLKLDARTSLPIAPQPIRDIEAFSVRRDPNLWGLKRFEPVE